MTSAAIRPASSRPRVGIACNARTRDRFLTDPDLDRLRRSADVVVEEYAVPELGWTATAEDPAAEARLARLLQDLDVLVVSHGSPRVGAALLERAPRLRAVGELEGDRFAARVDVAAARRLGITVIDTTHSSSLPVAEWALALALLGLRQQGRYHPLVMGEPVVPYGQTRPARELTGKRVGLIGFGHIAWRLRELLVPFAVSMLAYDPYAPRELADALKIDFASLPAVLGCDVVICLAPATPATQKLIGARELDLLEPDAVFVNVSRGVVVDTDALVAKAARADAWFGIDAHDPEPIPVDSPLRTMPNVFLSPHIAGVTAEAEPRFFSLMVDELERLFAGAEPRAQLTERVLAGRAGAPS